MSTVKLLNECNTLRQRPVSKNRFGRHSFAKQFEKKESGFNLPSIDKSYLSLANSDDSDENTLSHPNSNRKHIDIETQIMKYTKHYQQRVKAEEFGHTKQRFMSYANDKIDNFQTEMASLDITFEDIKAKSKF